MYIFVDSQNAVERWVPYPINKMVSYTNLVSNIAMTLKYDDGESA